ncbi:hypothetical protein H5410_050703 [Solanum commersonii]|uniref:Uncharacterized protein n=1 Tax=Solanum commersonii TaxID=4109 RepID=A0A9J5WYD4_SOLCO|nr:hypothetical protein H5410_050703 [Solanum commersonii]
MSLVSPNAPAYQALKEKIKLAKERSSWRVVKLFRDAVLYRPKLQDLLDAEGKSKKAIQMTKGRIIYLELRTQFDRHFSLALKISISKKLEEVANTILWLARERGFKTKITESMVCGYWVVMDSTRESES